MLLELFIFSIFQHILEFLENGPKNKKRLRDLKKASVAKIVFRKTVLDYFSLVRGITTIIIRTTITAVSLRGPPRKGNSAMTTNHARAHC